MPRADARGHTARPGVVPVNVSSFRSAVIAMRKQPPESQRLHRLFGNTAPRLGFHGALAAFRAAGWSFMLVACIGALATAADRPVVIKPEETTELLANPGIGWETFGYPAKADKNLPAGIPSTVLYVRWSWAQLEPQRGRLNTELLESTLKNARASGQQLALRVKCCNPRKGIADHPAWLKEIGGRELLVDYGDGPAEIPIPDFDDPVVLERHLDFIKRFGAAYDGHPDIQRVEIGSIGWWGEWHMSRCKAARLPTLGNRHKVIDAYQGSFTRTPLMMTNPANECVTYAVSRGSGWRADSLGDLGSFSPKWNHMRDAYPTAINSNNLQDVWKTAPVSFEAPRNVSEFVEKGWPVRSIFNYALALHGSSFNGKSAPLPNDGMFRAELDRFLRRLGYRFVLKEVAHPAHASAGGPLDVSMQWHNVGSAPCYQPYRVAYRLTGPDGSQHVVVGATTVSNWLPGSIELFTVDFPETVPDLPLGETHEVHDSITLPADLAAGDYTLAIGIVGEKNEKPVVRLAIKGRTQDGWYPLGTIEIAR
jgi:hypothetical protein